MKLRQPVANHDDLRKVTDALLRDCGLTIDDGGGNVTFAGKEPVRRTVIKAGAAPAIITAANAVAEAAIWKERNGEGQDIHVDLRKAWDRAEPLAKGRRGLHDGQRLLEDVEHGSFRHAAGPLSDAGWALGRHRELLPVAAGQDAASVEVRCRS